MRSSQTHRSWSSSALCAAIITACMLSVPAAANPLPLLSAGASGTVFGSTPGANPAGFLPMDFGALGVEHHVDWSYTCPAGTCSGYGLSMSGTSRVKDGVLGATSTVAVTGAPPAGFQATSLSYAQFTDHLTVTGGSGSGVLELQFAVEGSLSSPSSLYLPTAASLALNVSTAEGSFNNVYSSIKGSATAPVKSISQSFQSDATVDFYVPFTYGLPFGVNPVLGTDATFWLGYDALPYSMTTDFYDTATLVAARVYGGGISDAGLGLGDLVDDAMISAESGYGYGPDGLTTASNSGSGSGSGSDAGTTGGSSGSGSGSQPVVVPEPAPWCLFVLGLAGIGVAARRSRPRPASHTAA